MNVSFDSAGRTAGLQWGSLSELYTYDSFGRITEMKSFDSPSPKTRKFTYSGENTNVIANFNFGKVLSHSSNSSCCS